MAELTQDTIRPMQVLELKLQNENIKNAQQLYVGQYVDLVSGLLQPHTPGSATVCLGIVVGPGVPGNNVVLDAIVLPNAIAPGNTAATPPPQAVVNIGEHVLLGVTTIAGLTGAATDPGTLVYLTNGNDISTTQTSTDKPAGRVLRWNASTASPAWDVLIFSYGERGGY
jgi:hypothetical protein